MSKPQETDYGKGPFPRVTDFDRYQKGYDNINLGQPQYYEEGDPFWFKGEGWYFPDECLVLQGPYNTRQSAMNAKAEYSKFIS